MLVSSFVHCTAVLIFQLWEVQTLSPIPACPASCACDETLLVNCSSLGLPKAPSHIPATASALDLSHNGLNSLAPLASGHMYLRGLQHLWVGNNSLESLSMCSGIQGIVGIRTLTRRNPRCVSWAPDLQSLSADRNQLNYLPSGLGKMKSLKVLQLSHNKISEIGPADLTACTQLNELHLQYNLINTIHPEAFKGLQKLKVLDVSHNLLVAIPVPAYLSLRNLNVLVDISGNRWRCDCSLKTIRRWLSFDRELGSPTWKMVCFSPFHHAGKDLLYLEKSDLTCPQPVYSTPGVRKEVTLDEGLDFILSCNTTNQDFLHTRWWTPHGQISDSQRFLHITNTTERDAGLYVCVSGYHQDHVSVFSLHVRKRARDRRLRREAQIGLVEFKAEDNHNIQTNVPAVRTVQQSQFVLAVCLSVFITFIVAFVLGVILRPFLEKWYKQVRYKKKSTKSPPNSRTSSIAQRPYVNEGYSDTDDQEQQVHEGPRVTFGGVTEIHEQGSVPYYVTVEGSPPGSNTDVATLDENTDRVLEKNIEVLKEVPLREENKEMTRTGSTVSLNAESSNEMQLEYIPDPEDTAELEERSISPASFLSGEQQESQMSYEGKESIEQSVDFPTVSTDQEAAIPEFITDPFPLKTSESKEESVDELDPDLWNDSGESFSFTEGSPRSSSRALHVAASGQPPFQKEMSVDEPSDGPGSCNSSESGESKGGPAEYTINSEDDKDSEMSYSENTDLNYAERRPSASVKDILTEDQKTGTGTRLRQDTITLDPTDIRMTYIRGDSFDDEPFTEYNEYFPSSNISTVYEEPTQYNVHPVYRTSLKATNLVEEERSRTSICSEKEDEQGDHPRNLEMKSQSYRSHVGSSLDDSIFGTIDQTLDPIPRIKQHLYFSQSKSYPPIQAPLHPTEEELIPNKVVKTESKKFSSGDNFFVQIDASLDVLLKVKQYIQFSPSGSQLSYDSSSAAPINQVATPVVVSKTESLSDTNNIFYEGQIIPLPAMPKVQRYVQFRQSEPQTVHEHIPDVQEDSFFGQVSTSFDEVPKVKKYVQFSPSFQQLSTDSTPSESIHQVARPVVVSKMDSPSDPISIFYMGQNRSLQSMPKVQRHVQFWQSEPQSLNEHNPTIQGDSLFEQIPISFDEVPKVKHYVQFSPFKSQLSNDSVHSESIHQDARPVVVSKTELPSDTISIFYKGQNISLKTMPKVQRYVQLRQSEPQMVHEHTPDIQANGFFGQIPISFDEVPKVKHYVQFSPFKSQLSNELVHSESFNQIARPVVVSKRELPSDTISIFYKGQNISLQTMPKVQRYVQFRQSEPQTVQEYTSAIQGSSLFKQIPIPFDEVPKVKQYVQFSPSESKLSTDTVRTVHQCITTPETISKPESPSDTISIFYKGQTISLPAMPKVQRYVQFRQFEPQTLHEHTPDVQANRLFRQMAISFDEVPKVKRYILFSRSTQTSLPYSKKKYSLNDEQITHEIKTPMVTSKPQNAGDNFFVQTSTCLDGVPKVKRYIQFTQFKVIPETHLSPNFTLNETMKEGKLVKRNKSLSNYGDPVAEHNFFKQAGVFFDGIPKVRRRIQFTEHPPQLPVSQPLSTLKQPMTPTLILDTKSSQSKTNFFEVIQVSLENIPKVNRSLQFTQLEAKPSIQSIPSFSGKIHTPFDKVPKVKRYLQFIKPEPQPSSWPPSPSKITDTVTPAFSTKMQTTRSKEKGRPIHEGDDFFGQTVSTFNDLPKVKRHIQFTQAQPRLQPPLLHSLSNRTDKTLHARPELKAKDLTSEDYIQPAAGEHNILGPIGASFEIPKVKRHIQFTQTEPHLQPPLLHSLSNRTDKTIHASPELNANDLTGKHNMLGPIGASFEIPKVRRYIHFSPSSTQPSSLSSHRQTARPELWRSSASIADSKSNAEDIFFKKMDGSELPKVNRYIQFTHKHSTQSKSPNNGGVTDDVAKKAEFWGSDLSRVELKPPVTEDNVFGQLGTNLNLLQRVNRHVKFTLSESDPSRQSQSQTEKMTQKEWKTVNSPVDIDAKLSTKDTLFDGVFESFDNIPKVKKSILFTQSKAQNSNLTEVKQNIIPQLVPKTESVGHGSKSDEEGIPKKEDNYLGQLGMLLDDVPKVKKYVQFSQSEAFVPTQSSLNIKDRSSLLFSKAEIVTPVLATKTEHNSADYSSENKYRTDTSFNEFPHVKRYLQFTKSAPEPSGQSPLTSATTGSVSTAFSTKMQTTRSKDKGSAPIKGDDFFSQTVSSFKELPKVKRCIQFTQTEPHLQPPLLHSLSNRTDKTIHASSELKIKELASEDYIQPAAGKHNFLGPIGASFEIPKVRRYAQFSQSQTQILTEKMTKKDPPFTQSEYQHKTAAGDASSNYANTIFRSLDASFNQLPKEKRNVQIAQSEPYLSTEEVFKRSTKKNDLFGQTDGVPRLIRYRPHRQSEPHTQSLSPYISSQKWKMMDEESTDLRMFKTNVTPEIAQDLSQIQEALTAVKVTTETSRLHQRSPFLLNSDVYKQPAVEELSIQTSSNSLSGGKKHANIQSLSNRTALSTTEWTTLQSKLSGLGASSNESAALQTRKPLVLDPALQDVSQYITDKPAASPGNDDAREYLRDSSLARQRQERRRMLFQQKRRAMDGFSLTSESFTSQENDQWESL